MYRKDNPHQLVFEDFYLPFGGKLRSDNRWVVLSKQIPWQKIELVYESKFNGSDTGNVAKPARVALGALIIKERLGLTDRETVLQIQENPYLQYFLGFAEYEDKTNTCTSPQKCLPSTQEGGMIMSNSVSNYLGAIHSQIKEVHESR